MSDFKKDFLEKAPEQLAQMAGQKAVEYVQKHPKECAAAGLAVAKTAGAVVVTYVAPFAVGIAVGYGVGYALSRFFK